MNFNFLRKLNKRERIGLMLAALFLIFTATDRLIVRRIRSSIETLDNRIEQKIIELEQLRAANAALPRVTQEFLEYRPFVQRLGTDQQEIAGMLEDIGNIAKATKVEIDTRSRDPETDDSFTHYNVEVEAEAEVKELIRFLTRINASKRAMRIKRFQVRLRNTNTTTLRASMLVTRLVLDHTVNTSHPEKDESS
jgi:type II secretory pathway component PulM